MIILVLHCLSHSPQCSHGTKIPGAIKVPTPPITEKNKSNNIETKVSSMIDTAWSILTESEKCDGAKSCWFSIQGSSKNWRNYQIATFYFLFWCGASCNLCSFPGSSWKSSTHNIKVCGHGFKLADIVWNFPCHGWTLGILWRTHCSKSKRIHQAYSRSV